MNDREKIIMNCVPAWVVAVDMGYGHQRPAHALKCLAQNGEVISANNYPGIPASDKKMWGQSRQFYEWISKFKNVPIVGNWAFRLFDYVQRIQPFYPRRDLSKPNLQLRSMYYLLKKGWGRHLIEKLNEKDVPLVTTFFAVAFMAEYHNFRNEIYAVVTDADVSRSWVPPEPNLSRIKYFCPNKRTFDRLRLYGVRKENLFLTGFPLPLENIGPELEIAKKDLLVRLANLDPKRRYLEKYKHIIEVVLGTKQFDYSSDRPLSLTFAVGGAGAQRELGVEIVKSLKQAIIEKKIQINLIAGIHNTVYSYFKKELKKLGLKNNIGDNIYILHAPSKEEYFGKFDELMRVTDILWTKPSELSFYSALGIPIIIAPPIGSQEDFNKVWLKTVGSGIAQEDPRYAGEWLFEWLDSGWLAEAAMEGYIDAPKFGTYNIGQIISKKPEEVKEENIVLQF